MKTVYAANALPDCYAETEKIDLVKNKRQMLLVNGLAVILALITLAAGFLLQPESAIGWLSLDEEPLYTLVQCLIALGGTLLYIIGHEAVHGAFMWHYSHSRPDFGLSFTYAYAGSQCFFAKQPYLIIALAPVVVWSVGLCALALLLPADWFWTVWVIQIMNISGAAGDFYVFFHLLNAPGHILVQDTGTAMTVYAPQA